MGVEIHDLHKSYGTTKVISGIDLSVADGEMLVLLGPSGCGKTTTMRCIAGLELPDSGRISIDGRTVFDDAARCNIPANKRNVGMVFQSYAIWPHMTVRQNVAFPLEMQKVPSREIGSRVGEVLEIVGLSGLEDRGASLLSGGQMQRVALARSLVMRPSLLLFDEPLSNLDARLRDHLRDHLREIQTRFNITSVYVTHDQREALALADKIVVMERGNILQTADPATLYDHPASRSIAEFLGYSNVFKVTSTAPNTDGTDVVLEPSGRTLTSRCADNRLDGPLAACARPEDIEIDLAKSSGASSPNSVLGEVMLASFMGSQTQYRVRSDNSEIWEVLSANRNSQIGRGSKVRLSIDPNKLRVLHDV